MKKYPLRKIGNKGLKKIERKLDYEYQCFFRELCGEYNIRSEYSGLPMEVCHHPREKSRSAFMRYFLPNFVPLTNAEHAEHHLSRGDSKIMNRVYIKRGVDWALQIELLKDATISKDWKYYSDARIQLENMKENRELLANNYKEKGYFILSRL
jgi:hypothetical protein